MIGLIRSTLLGALAFAPLGCSDNLTLSPAPVPSSQDADADADPIACQYRAQPSGGPLAFGQAQVDKAATQLGVRAPVSVTLASDPCAQRALAAAHVSVDDRPESFAILPRFSGILIVGRDEVGAMYGALELAERLVIDGASAIELSSPIVAAPHVPVCAANLFLLIPASGENPWWFREEGFWTEYLDLMALARLNFLDLHGMYNPDNTVFPNALLYFASSASHPELGIAATQRERNAAMLGRIIEMARARGIRVGLMTYNTGTSPTGETVVEPPDEDLRVYTREAARDLATRAPGLWRTGFRIGESGHGAQWLIDTIVKGVKEAGTGVGVYTRTWLTSKQAVLAVVEAAGPDTMVQAKYNGEQLGAPYVIAGGLMAQTQPDDWSIYS